MLNINAHQFILNSQSEVLFCILIIQEEIAKDLLSGDDEETQSSADDLTPSVTSHEATDFFPRPLRCRKPSFIIVLKKS